MYHFFKPIFYTDNGYFLINYDEFLELHKFPQFQLEEKINSLEDLQNIIIDKEDFLNKVGISSVEEYSHEMIISIAEGYEQGYFFRVVRYEMPPPNTKAWMWIKDYEIEKIKDMAWWDLQQFQTYYSNHLKN